MPLYRHLLDAAYLAGELWDHAAPPHVEARLSRMLGYHDARLLAMWLAGVHDIGKATPVFQAKVPELADHVHGAGLTFPNISSVAESRHGLLGDLIVERWLQERCTGLKRRDAWRLTGIVGAHHGVPTDSNDRTNLRERLAAWPGELGDESWRRVQDELLNYVTQELGVEDLLERWTTAVLDVPDQNLLTAIVIEADWIASSEELFGYLDADAAPVRAERAWRELAMPGPWRPVREVPDPEAMMRERFLIDVPARPMQETVWRAARTIEEPSLVVIEAPMGMGKTEAALGAAEILAERFACSGVFFALPTMATSNAMYARVKRWLSRLPDAEGPGRVQSMMLMHGKSALNREFEDTRPWRIRSVDEDTQQVAVAHSWLAGKKRSILANFVVGTIDQLLFAALRVKHVMLRHLGLAGKVVIIDEVHAFDSYMNQYLDRALEWLGAYGVPVILLSATLPTVRRAELAAAYRSGLLGRVVEEEETGEDHAYPLLTIADAASVRGIESPSAGNSVSVGLERCSDDDDALVALLRKELVDGGCVGIVRSTVARAQDTARLLREAFPEVDIILDHSRFLAIDRSRIEEELLGMLGRNRSSRPERLIVVGTQVLEQSLDIDFDLLISDIAPIDLLLQRIGRLHRHPIAAGAPDRPARLASPRCIVTGVEDWAADPPVAVRGIRYIYGDQLLWRTLVEMQDLINSGSQTVSIPEDIPVLVNRVYGMSGSIPGAWEDEVDVADHQAMRAREDKKAEAEKFLLRPPWGGEGRLDDLLRANGGELDADSPKGAAQVRDTDAAIEVVVVQEGPQGDVRLLPWIAEEVGMTATEGRLSTSFEPEERLARLAAQCTVRLPGSLSGPWIANDVIDELEARGGFEGWQQSRWLRGELVLVLDSEMKAKIAGFQVEYRKEEGLMVTKSHEESGGDGDGN